MTACTLLWDASALAKRYAPEGGSETVDTMFADDPWRRMVVPLTTYAETFALLVRKRNAEVIARRSFGVAAARLQAETFGSARVLMLSLSDRDVLASLAYIERHALNSTDAALLAAFLAFQNRYSDERCYLVASDRRLLRAASAEGLRSLNPETDNSQAVRRILEG